MQDSTKREKVLKKIRHSLIHKTMSPFPHADFDTRIYHVHDETPEIYFANKLMESGGHFVYCENKFDFAEQIISLGEERKWENIICQDDKLGAFLKQCEYPFVTDTNDLIKNSTVITLCECLIVRTGSILVSSAQAHGRKSSAIAHTHLILAYSDQLVNDIKDALQLIKLRYGNNHLPSLVSIITGPSKTADIELVQVTGAHGPTEIFVFLMESEEEI